MSEAVYIADPEGNGIEIYADKPREAWPHDGVMVNSGPINGILAGKEEGQSVKAAIRYVEANGVRSPVFSMEVMDLPTVDRLVLEYRFPAYTGLEARTVDPGGDVAALQGTEVTVKVSPTMTTPGGRILLNENESATLHDLASEFSVSAERIRQIEQKALSRMKTVLSEATT